MKILHLEDISEVTYIFEDVFPDMGLDYEKATSIYEINELLSNSTYDCIILDLNLPTDGLSKELKEKSRDGKITGWIWLKHIGISRFGVKLESVIIYSDYIHDLDEIDKNELKHVRKLKKRKGGNRNSSIKELHKGIMKIKNN